LIITILKKNSFNLKIYNDIHSRGSKPYE
jgi:hypothetical protein